MDKDQIFITVCQCIGEVLDVEIDNITAQTKLIDDLGADSLDLLDLTFHLEQRFKLKLSPREMEKRAREELGAIPLEVGGVYTPRALELIRKAMPEVPDSELGAGLSTQELPRRFRVATMVNLVTIALEERNGQSGVSDRR